jgi:Arc/MetJ-type ribon-helix-helix transcriptional regulator
MTMLAVRIADETVNQIDSLVAAGWTINRTTFVREAIDAALAHAAETVLDRQISNALDRVAESPEHIEALKASTRAWIASLPEEDW